LATHTMEPRTIRFKDILAEYGVPFYLKVDIETFDHYCLEDLDPSDLPQYVSFEAQNLRDIVTMRGKGFQAFKIVRQQDHRQVCFDPTHFKATEDVAEKEAKATGKGATSGWPPALLRALGLSRRAPSPEVDARPQMIPYQPEADWQFSGGRSGPFGEETDGPWRTFEQAAMSWLAYDARLLGPDCPGQGKWHDVHYRAPVAASA
jgi:hypothetical protein